MINRLGYIQKKTGILLLILFILYFISGCSFSEYQKLDYDTVIYPKKAKNMKDFDIETYLNSNINIQNSRLSKEVMNVIAPELIEQFKKEKLIFGSPIFIRIFKKSKELEVWIYNKDKYYLFDIYNICSYGFMGLGPKIKQFDGRAPEGFYYVTPGNMNPWSDYRLSFNLGYPNSYDSYYSRTGDYLMVHGQCVSAGCYAMGSENIDKIYTLAYAALKNGQKFFRVHCFPFRMTEENMNLHSNNEWYEFWENLKEGYDWFENEKNPPNVTIEKGEYRFD